MLLRQRVAALGKYVPFRYLPGLAAAVCLRRQMGNLKLSFELSDNSEWS